MLQYDHIGIPTREKRADLIYIPDLKLWTSDYEKDPFRVEWIFFEKDCQIHPLIQRIPHVGFQVKDIEKAVHGRKILMDICVYGHERMAFIEHNGAPIEFLEKMT